MKRINISVINDLVTDQRVHKIANTLTNLGYHVRLTGRKLPNSLPVSIRPYETSRMNLLFTKGVFFYAFFNIRLFFRLLLSKTHILIAVDLDTLLANFLVSRFKKIPLLYDCHEYFTEVPELTGRGTVRKFWIWLERKIVTKIPYALTVCDSLSGIYFEKYGIRMAVVRNLPYRSENPDFIKTVLPDRKKSLIYQGAINRGRGLETMIAAMVCLPHIDLWIVGDGDITDELKQLAKQLSIEKQVFFKGKIPFEELHLITSQADIGLSIEEDVCLNYHYALPNKLFDYIQCGIPVLVSNLPEMRKVVEQFNIGQIILDRNPVILGEQIMNMLKDENQMVIWKENVNKAAIELCWEWEEEIVKTVMEKIEQDSFYGRSLFK